MFLLSEEGMCPANEKEYTYLEVRFLFFCWKKAKFKLKEMLSKMQILQKLQKVMVTMGSEANEINNFYPIPLHFVGFILKPLKLPLGVHDSIKYN